MQNQKGRKVPQLKKSVRSNSLEVDTSVVQGFPKAPGQTGIHAPTSLNAIRKPKKSERKTGAPFGGGGVSKPYVSDQTYDCYGGAKSSRKRR